jgi:aminoglycoside phosphotransferase (APT) family kinase protein
MYRFHLTDPPPGLAGDLVARIIPGADVGVWESTIQRDLTRQGFATPTVRLTEPETSPLGRYLIVMDHIDGHPPMAGLSITTIAGQIPNLIRHLPDQLADVTAALHRLDPEPLSDQLDQLTGDDTPGLAGFIQHQIDGARAFDRPDLVTAGQRILDTAPPTTIRTVCHGDLHPFNLLITQDGPVLVDWSVASVAHPAFDLAFTELMLANPPIPLPKVGAIALKPVARRIARRFLASYRDLTREQGIVIDDDVVAWHRQVHALRILVEVAGWDATGSRPTFGHPWLVLEPVAISILEL